MYILKREFVCNLIGLSTLDVFYENLKSRVGERVGEEMIEAIEVLGLLEETPISKMSTPLDTTCHYLMGKLALGKNWLYSSRITLQHIIDEKIF